MIRSAWFPALVVLASVTLPCRAQIYADFTVSHGGTPLGTFRARLDYDKAPRTCANFIGLATGQRPWIDVTNGRIMENTPFYDGLTFHRLIHNFMIQGGSPNGQGTDGPGYTIMEEFHPDLRHSGRYMLSMAKTSLPNTTGSQFFITLQSASHLDDKHSVFGEVIDGKAIIDGFANATSFPTGANDKPLQPIVMESVVISGDGLAGFDLDDPGLDLTQVSPVNGGLSVVPGVAVTFTPTTPLIAGQQLEVFRSSQLSSWVARDPVIAGFGSTPLAAGLIDTASAPEAFYRMTKVDYPESRTVRSLANRVLVVDAPGAGGVITLTYNNTGNGGSYQYNASAGTITSSQYTPDGYGGTLLVYTSNLIPLYINMAFNGETTTHITGVHELSGKPAESWLYYGSGTITLTK